MNDSGPNPTLGALIAQARRELAVKERRDISAAEIADSLEIPRGTYSRYESGERIPNKPTRIAIALELRVSADFFESAAELVSGPSQPERKGSPKLPGIHKVGKVRRKRDEEEPKKGEGGR